MASGAWERVAAEVTSARLYSTSRGSEYREIRYKYRYRDRDYQQVVRAHPDAPRPDEGERIEIIVNPERPGESARNRDELLRHELSPFGFFALLALAFAAAGFGGACLFVGVRRLSRARGR